METVLGKILEGVPQPCPQFADLPEPDYLSSALIILYKGSLVGLDPLAFLGFPTRFTHAFLPGSLVLRQDPPWIPLGSPMDPLHQRSESFMPHGNLAE